ncbi:hypothetical protein [Sorangium sp. So ce1078]
MASKQSLANRIHHETMAANAHVPMRVRPELGLPDVARRAA